MIPSTYILFVLFSSFCKLCNENVIATSFTRCRLRKGFSIAHVEPFNATLTYGCEMTSDSSSEYHFFSSYKSAGSNHTIDVVLIRESRQPKTNLKLYLVSYERIHWRLTADNKTTLKLVRLSSTPSSPMATIEIDMTRISLESPVKYAKFFRGVWPSSGQFVEIAQSSTSTITRMEETGHLRSFSAVYSACNVTIPIGVTEMLPYIMSTAASTLFSSPPPTTDTVTMNHARVDNMSIDSSGDRNIDQSGADNHDIDNHDDDDDADDLNYTTSSTISMFTSENNSTSTRTLIVPVSVTLSVVAFVVTVAVVVAVLRKRNQKIVSEKHIEIDNESLARRNDDIVKMVKNHIPDVLIICTSRLNVECLLGKGNFGLVYKGYCNMAAQQRDRSTIQYTNKTYQIAVAIKSMRDEVRSEDMTGFLHECASMYRLSHPNLLGLIGVCAGKEDIGGPLIVLPYMQNGDLKSYLSKQRDAARDGDFTPKELMSYVIQICSGMEYLSSCSLVHRDLAARNCMLNSMMTVKIADFGMARYMNEDAYYRQQGDTPMPVKWMAPESLLQRVYSEKSDVWSFGVTSWEVFSLGKSPYKNVPNIGIVDHLRTGHRLNRPAECSPNTFEVIASCWQWAEELRYNFKHLLKKLNDLFDLQFDYVTLKNVLENQ